MDPETDAGWLTEVAELYGSLRGIGLIHGRKLLLALNGTYPGGLAQWVEDHPAPTEEPS